MRFTILLLIIGLTFHASWATAPNVGTASQPFRPFDENIYTLSYQTFLEAKNIPEAFALAQSAVLQRPKLLDWRERYAKTAEWNGQQAVALEQWEYMSVANPKEEYFQEVIRIAKMINNDKASAKAWEGISKMRTLKTIEWTSLANSFENMGDPDLAERFLLNQIQNSNEDSLKFYLTALYLRMGKDEPAIKIYSSLSEKLGMKPTLGLGLVKIYCRHGNFIKAAEIMNKTQIPDVYDNFEFWRYRAEVYNATQNFKSAFYAYEMIYLNEKYELGDLQNLLELSIGIDSSLGGRISLLGWKKFHEPDFLIYYLERCININRIDSAAIMLSRLSSASQSLFSNMPYFFDLSSRIHQFQGQRELARKEMIHAYELEPESEIYRSGVLWILIDQGRMNELAEYTRRWDSKSIQSPIMLLPLAISYKMQNHFQTALDYFERMDKGDLKNDFPFLLNYAELFESIGDGDEMRKTFLRAKKTMNDSSNQKKMVSLPDWREAKAKWNARFGNGDLAEKQMTAMLVQSNHDENAKQIVYDWKMAVGENPDDAMAELRFSPGARQEAANEREENFKEAQQILRKENSGQSLLWESYSNPLFFEQKYLVNGNISVNPEVSLGVTITSRQLPRFTQTLPVSVPKNEEVGSIQLKRNSASNLTEISAGYSQGKNWTPATLNRNNLFNASLHEEWMFQKKSSLLLDYKYNTTPDENPLLQLTGTKDSWGAEAYVTFPYWTSINVRAEEDFFYDRVRHFLGTGSLYRGDISLHPFNTFSIGVESVFQHFNSGVAITKINGSSYIADWLLDSDFPQSCFQSMGHFDWEQKASLGNLHFDFSAASQLGMTRFLNNYPIHSGFWEPNVGARGGIGIWPTRSQQFSFTYDYTQGTLPNSGEETKLQTSYEYFFR